MVKGRDEVALTRKCVTCRLRWTRLQLELCTSCRSALLKACHQSLAAAGKISSEGFTWKQMDRTLGTCRQPRSARLRGSARLTRKVCAVHGLLHDDASRCTAVP